MNLPVVILDVCSIVDVQDQALEVQSLPLFFWAYANDQHFFCQKQRQKLPEKKKTG